MVYNTVFGRCQHVLAVFTSVRELHVGDSTAAAAQLCQLLCIAYALLC